RTLEGIITSWNPAAERMYGYTNQEIIGKSVDVLVPRERRHELDDVLVRIRAGQRVERLQTVRVRKDGTMFPASITISPIHDADGAIIGASAIHREMTEQERAAQYARSLIEADLDPLVTISPEGKIIDLNEATVKITGVPREALIASDYSQYVTEPDKAVGFFQQVFEQGSVTDFLLTVRHRDGTLTDVTCNASVYRDAGGNVLGVFAAARDMTQQRQALAAAQQMAAIVEFSGAAIFGCTLQGIITSWNPAAGKMYGYSGQEIIGKSGTLLSPKDREGEFLAILARVKDGETVEGFEPFSSRSGAAATPSSLTLSPIRDSDGKIIAASAIAREMTDRRLMERARSLTDLPGRTLAPPASCDAKG
ncbi:MAG: PAS domain S-box protein, partial [Candidatus Saccharimonas sp.]|nr:PAS domain S-box protein [Planctomycetaceae bacterium]